MPLLRRTEQAQVFLQKESEMNETGPVVKAAESRFTTKNTPPTFADGMTAEDDRRFLELTNGLTHND